MSRIHARLISFVPLMLLAFAATDAAWAHEAHRDGRRYKPSDDAVADVQQALARAKAGDRRALVIMGANWCHDSRALATRLQHSPLSGVVKENYELVFVDVGFLAKGREVLDVLDVPQFYSTPTVLIVDPVSEQVVNNEDRHIWGNANNIDMATSVNYFEKHATGGSTATPGTESAELDRLNAEIDQFEKGLAERVAAGYAVVGPLLAERVAGNSPEAYQASWDELRDFRMAVPGDVLALRAEARRRVAAGEQDIALEYPDYPPLSWEAR